MTAVCHRSDCVGGIRGSLEAKRKRSQKTWTKPEVILHLVLFRVINLLDFRDSDLILQILLSSGVLLLKRGPSGRQE